MAGYSGYSMSNNAITAYENGEAPYSKWSKISILAQIPWKFFTDEQKTIVRKTKIDVLKKVFLTERGWHHTSKEYNKTYFYGIVEISSEQDARWRVEEITECNEDEKKKLQKNKLDAINFLIVSAIHFDPSFIESTQLAISKANMSKMKTIWSEIHRNYKN